MPNRRSPPLRRATERADASATSGEYTAAFQLSAFSFQLSALGFQLSALGFQRSAPALDSHNVEETMQDFRNLSVWQRSRRLTKVVYEMTLDFPGSEEFGLKSQMRRAA